MVCFCCGKNHEYGQPVSTPSLNFSCAYFGDRLCRVGGLVIRARDMYRDLEMQYRQLQLQDAERLHIPFNLVAICVTNICIF